MRALTEQPQRSAETFAMASAYYQTARQEIIARIGHRDQALALYLVAAAAIASAAVTDVETRWPLLLVIPVVAAGAASVLRQHNDVVGAIGSYLASEFDAWVRSGLHDAPPQWDASLTLKGLKNQPFSSRRLAQHVLICGTAAVSLVVAVAGGIEAGANALVIAASGTLGLVCVALAILAVELSFRGRKKHRFGDLPGAHASAGGEE
jgi:hypothetical protein